MAKLSVYVPDDLLEDAKRIDPDFRPSAILQDVLRSRIRDHSLRPYRQLSPDLETQLAAAQARVLDRVRDVYRVGYTAGITLSELLPWQAFENLAASGWDLQAWVKDFDAEQYEDQSASDEERDAGEAWLRYETAWEAMTDNGYTMIPCDASHVPVGIAAEGFVDAVRDVWLGAAATRDAVHRVGDDEGLEAES